MAAVRLSSLTIVLWAAVAGCDGDPGTTEPDAALPTPDAAPVGQGSPPMRDIAINEVATEPATGPDWIELVNRGGAAATLDGMFVSDAADRPDHYYQFPAGTTLAPGAYLLVWADSGDPGAGHHAPFELGQADSVVLLGPTGLTVDRLIYLAQSDGRTLARVPDHEGLFFAVAPTMGAPNPETMP